MPRQRAFDYDLLKELVLKHPDWSSYKYAQELTKHERRKDPAAPQVVTHTVDTCIHRHRREWEEEENMDIPPRVQHFYDGYMPPRGLLHPDERMATAMRYLRYLAHRDAGNYPDQAEAEKWRIMRLATRWEARMKHAKNVLDIDPEGRVFERSARPDELIDGELAAVAAWMIPGWTPPREAT